MKMEKTKTLYIMYKTREYDVVVNTDTYDIESVDLSTYEPFDLSCRDYSILEALALATYLEGLKDVHTQTS